MPTVEYLEHDKSCLFPRITDRGYVEFSRLEMALEDRILAPWCRPGFSLGDHLVAELVMELDGAIVSVSHHDLQSWEVCFEDAFSDALANLRERTTEGFTELDSGLYTGLWGDYYANARILLPELFADLRLQGAPVVVVPNRDAVLVAGSEDASALIKLDNVAWHQYQERYAISPAALVSIGGEWRTVGSVHQPLLPRIVGSSKMWYSEVYFQTRQLLAVVFPRTAIGFHCTANQDGGDEIISFSAVHVDHPTLVAASDILVFVKGHPPRVVGVLDLLTAKEVLGPPFKKSTDIWPDRYFYSGALADLQLQRIKTGHVGPWYHQVISEFMIPQMAKEEKEVHISTCILEDDGAGDRYFHYVTSLTFKGVSTAMKRKLLETTKGKPASIHFYVNPLDENPDNVHRFCLEQVDLLRKTFRKKMSTTEIQVVLLDNTAVP